MHKDRRNNCNSVNTGADVVNDLYRSSLEVCDLTSLQQTKPAQVRSAVIESLRHHVNSGLARLAELVGSPLEVSSLGNYVFDEHHRRYLDCGGYSVFFTGHGHPRVIATAIEQIQRNALSSRSLLNPEPAEAAETLSRVAPDGLDYVFFLNSGAEAVEFALKLACLNRKTRLISMSNGYHGKTLGALGVTGRTQYREPFKELVPDASFVCFGDVTELETTLSTTNGDGCVILEPVQAEGGVVIPPDGYLRQVETVCRRFGAFLILDEIQTGLGRLGYWWGAEREGVVPDALLVGKALGGGVVPISAVVTSAQNYGPMNRDPFLHSSTFGGNPLATAVANTTIHIIEEEGLVERSHSLGDLLIPEIDRLLASECPNLVRQVRGLGLLIAIEFESDQLAADFMIEMRKHGVLVCWSLNAHSVVRLTPSALLTESDVALLLETLAESAMILNERYHDFANERVLVQ
jgi:putrescine aminotransferase